MNRWKGRCATKYDIQKGMWYWIMKSTKIWDVHSLRSEMLLYIL